MLFDSSTLPNQYAACFVRLTHASPALLLGLDTCECVMTRFWLPQTLCSLHELHTPDYMPWGLTYFHFCGELLCQEGKALKIPQQQVCESFYYNHQGILE